MSLVLCVMPVPLHGHFCRGLYREDGRFESLVDWLGLGGGVCMHILVCEKDKMKDTHEDI